jgi:hypothetical protein
MASTWIIGNIQVPGSPAKTYQSNYAEAHVHHDMIRCTVEHSPVHHSQVTGIRFDIRNIQNADIVNAPFYGEIDNAVFTYVEGSFEVNGVLITPTTITTTAVRYTIPKIAVGDVMVIRYKLKAKQ